MRDVICLALEIKRRRIRIAAIWRIASGKLEFSRALVRTFRKEIIKDRFDRRVALDAPTIASERLRAIAGSHAAAGNGN